MGSFSDLKKYENDSEKLESDNFESECDITDPEVQKTYYHAKKILDSLGFTKELSIYLRLGRKNQPFLFRSLLLVFVWVSVPFCFLAGVIMLFTNPLFGVAVIFLGIVMIQVFAKVFYSVKSSRSTTSSSQQLGSHRLMKIVAKEMSRGYSTREIAGILKVEIQNTLSSLQNEQKSL